MVKVSIARQHMEFELSEVAELENGPILVSAFSAIPAGDYFLVTPSLIPPSSAVVSSLQNAQFDESSLLLLHGGSILAELSAVQQADLLAWLKHLKRT